MKLKHKVLIFILLSIVIILSTSNVFAKGYVYYAWTWDNNGKIELVFRTFVTPYYSLVTKYNNLIANKKSDGKVDKGQYTYTYNGKKYTSRWIDQSSEKGTDMPSSSTYGTMGFVFHTKPLSSYSGNNNGSYGYANLGDYPLGEDIGTVGKAYKNYKHKKVDKPSNIRANDPFFTKEVFYTIYRVSGKYEVSGDSSTGMKLSGAKANSNTELRYSIVDFGKGNVYISDNIIHSEHLEKLIKQARTAMNTLDVKEFYVSNIVATKNKNNSSYEAAYSAANFFKTTATHGWSNNSKGSTNKGMGSVINLYDNIIKIPNLSSRKVYVRHINIGNNTTISKAIVNNASRLTTNISLKLKIFNKDNTINKTIDGTDKKTGYEEYFEKYKEDNEEKYIPIDCGFTKSAVSDTKTYKCIGYNVSTKESKTEAQNAINEKIAAGKFTKRKSGENVTVTVNSKAFNKSSDVTIIDFYYSEYEKNVYVNHVIVDKDKKVVEVKKQTITPNNSAKEDGTTEIPRINSNKYVKEVYKKRLGHDIQVATANTKFDYLGYKLYTTQTDVKDLVGNKIGKFSKKEKATTAELDSTNIQVNFYYSEFEKEVYVNHVLLDQNNVVLAVKHQKITPNENAFEKVGKTYSNEISRINKDKYMKEIYNKRIGHNIQVRKADSLGSDIKYLGYKTYTTVQSTKDLAINKTEIGKFSKKEKEATAVLNSTNIQVNFYYKKDEDELKQDDVYVNHVFLDNENKVIGVKYQNITPNKDAQKIFFDDEGNMVTDDKGNMVTEKINRINNDTYVKEQYKLDKNTEIETRIADSLEDDIDVNIKFLGYKYYKNPTSVSSIVNKEETDLIGYDDNNKPTISYFDTNKNKQINYYYTFYDSNVYVNHILVDIDGRVLDGDKQKIIPNETAKEDGTTEIERVNEDRYMKEEYEKRFNHSVVVRIADSLKEKINEGTVKYYGYEVRENESSSFNLVEGSMRLNLNTEQEATIEKGGTSVNFYYFYGSKKEYKEPDKDITGKVFVKKKDEKEIETVCPDDESSTQVVSIPSGINATVGIKEVPRYMVGAITTEYNNPTKDNEINLKIVYKFLNEEKTKEYKGLKYRAGFYKITDMALYKLNNMTVYDAQNGDIETVGRKLFDWQQKKVTPKTVSIDFEMKGIDGNTKINNSSINNFDNYVNIQLKDNIDNEKNIKPSIAKNGLIKIEVLTENEIKKVDANGDGKITNDDKDFAKTKLNNLKNTLDLAKTNKESKETILNNAKTQLTNLKKEFENKTNVKNQKYNDYIIKQKELDKQTESYNKFVEEYNNEKQKLDNLNDELKNLEKTKAAKEQEKQDAEDELNSANIQKSQMLANIENLRNERNNLAALANCTDTVEEEVYIYMEQSEKDALEMCKQNKENYQKNLDENKLENAEEEYNNYLNNDYADIVNKNSELEKEIDTLKTDIKNKKKEVSAQQIILNNKETMKMTLFNDLNDLNDEVDKLYEDYDNYNNNEYIEAETNYNNYVNGKYVENAQNDYNNAVSVENTAQTNYNSYNSYKTTMDSLFDNYKNKYDTFNSINKSTERLQLDINISVQNMIVKVKTTNGKVKHESLLATSEKNTDSYSNSLSSYKSSVANGDIPLIKTEKLVISKDVYSNITSTKTSQEDFDNGINDYSIDSSILNGVRTLAGKAEYKLETVIGNKEKPEDIQDNVYYADEADTQNGEDIIFKLKNNTLTKTYKVDTSIVEENGKEVENPNRYKEVEPINIYTPISVSTELTSNKDEVIDQRIKNNKEKQDTEKDTDNEEEQAIQMNVPFKIEFGNENGISTPLNRYITLSDTSRFSMGYYIKFDFDVHKVKINGKIYKNGSRIPAGRWIGMITKKSEDKKAYIEAQAYGNLDDNKVDILSEAKSSYIVRAVAYNATLTMRNKLTWFDTLQQMREEIEEIRNSCAVPDIGYFAERSYDVVILNRLFDFKVTDVKDVNWKNVFRRNTKDTTNSHTGTLYYSGTTKWDTKSEKANNIVSRTSSEIGRNPLRILPIGPYKSSNVSYIKAPKLGYRFSYDVKATGSYYNSDGEINTNKEVLIKTEFYYISKDGKKILKEYDGSKEGIYLFYKKSDGTYQRIDENGGGYELSFVPNDGYRYVEGNDLSTLSKKSVKLGDLRKIELKYNMATVSSNGSYIVYYGEYKLPNSTIAVEVNKDGKYNINEPLKNGYIGVKFKISAFAGQIDEKNIQLSYATNTNDFENTSQWDFEGYLGYTKRGKALSQNDGLKIKLENGNLNINSNEMYNLVKGMVILYDIDARAANDFN